MQADKHPFIFYFTVSLSIFFALWLLVLPMPLALQYFRPEWSCLLVVYWILTNPQQLSFGFAFMLGILQDIFEQSIWGANALALVVVAYVCTSSYRRVQSYSIWQQSLWVLVLVGLYQLTANAVVSLEGIHVSIEKQIPSLIVSAMLWSPLVFLARSTKKRLGLI